MRVPSCLRAVLLLATVSFGLLAQSTRDQEREAPEVRGLILKGVQHVDVQELIKSISTQTSKCRSLLIKPFCLVSHSPTFEDKHYLNRAELRRDVLRIRLIYWKHGYREAQVDTIVDRTGPKQVRVTFDVHENQPTVIRKMTLNYDSTLINDRTRDRLMLLHVNDPVDLTMLDSMRVLFQNELWDQGYGDAVVDTSLVVNDSARLADVGFTMTPNRRTTVGSVTIEGMSKIAEATVRNSLTFKGGDLYRQSDLLDSQRNLYESNLFRLASIFVPPVPDSVKNVTIDVTEAPLHEVRYGPGLNNIDFAQFQAHYTDYNLFGGARRLDIDGTIGNLFASSLQGRGFFRDVTTDAGDQPVQPYLQPTYQTSIDFKQPSFLQRPKDAFGLGAFAHRAINPGVFIDQGYGGQATVTHQITTRAPLSLNYRYERNRVQAGDVYFCVNYGVCDTLTIGTLSKTQSLSPLTLTGFIDRSDQPFSPTKGYVARLDIESASTYTASDYRYNRVFLDAAIYGHRSRTKDVYSAHLRAGFVRALSGGNDNGAIHPRKRFYAGGANSVRGFGESQLGPRILTIDGDSTLFNASTTLPGAAGKCALTIDAVKYCDPNAASLRTTNFTPQPLGGTSLLEGSIEYRVPLPLGQTLRNFVGAVFIDGGIVGRGQIRGVQSLSAITHGTAAITPGFGIRYASPVGPIRVDFGINPNRSEDLSVVTAVRDSTGAIKIVALPTARRYSQGGGLHRLVLHFSIGEAY
jgi:outer membrane protein assembly factor BamA